MIGRKKETGEGQRRKAISTFDTSESLRHLSGITDQAWTPGETLGELFELLGTVRSPPSFFG